MVNILFENETPFPSSKFRSSDNLFVV